MSDNIPRYNQKPRSSFDDPSFYSHSSNEVWTQHTSHSSANGPAGSYVNVPSEALHTDASSNTNSHQRLSNDAQRTFDASPLQHDHAKPRRFACPICKANPRVWFFEDDDAGCLSKKPVEGDKLKDMIRHHVLGTHWKLNKEFSNGDPRRIHPSVFINLERWWKDKKKRKVWTGAEACQTWSLAYNIVIGTYDRSDPVDAHPDPYFSESWFEQVLDDEVEHYTYKRAASRLDYPYESNDVSHLLAKVVRHHAQFVKRHIRSTFSELKEKCENTVKIIDQHTEVYVAKLKRRWSRTLSALHPSRPPSVHAGQDTRGIGSFTGPTSEHVGGPGHLSFDTGHPLPSPEQAPQIRLDQVVPQEMDFDHFELGVFGPELQGMSPSNRVAQNNNQEGGYMPQNLQVPFNAQRPVSPHYLQTDHSVSQFQPHGPFQSPQRFSSLRRPPSAQYLNVPSPNDQASQQPFYGQNIPSSLQIPRRALHSQQQRNRSPSHEKPRWQPYSSSGQRC